MGRARLYGAFAVAVAAIACYWELQDPRDHYAALGVSRSATTKEIRAGYKAKALLYHPDKVMSRRFAPWYVRLWRLATKGEARCARRFILASEAVETLADDEQRQIYDVELEARESADRQDRSRRRGRLVQRLDVRQLRAMVASLPSGVSSTATVVWIRETVWPTLVAEAPHGAAPAAFHVAVAVPLPSVVTEQPKGAAAELTVALTNLVALKPMSGALAKHSAAEKSLSLPEHVPSAMAE